MQIPYYSYAELYPTKLLALYHALHDTIVNGTLAHGARLPSTRDLAKLYGLSRGTANQAYDMLAAEGYLTGTRGSGTYVAYRREPAETAGSADGARSAEAAVGEGAGYVRLSAWGQRVAELPLRAEARDERGVDFGRFVPDVGAFPREAWSRCLHAQVRGQSAAAGRGEQAEPLGSAELREAIARYVRRARGIAAQAEHVAVTGGSMQALALIAQLLLGPGETAVAETPAFRGVRHAVYASGARCIDAEVDAQGIVPADWDARALFVTPARQFPTGAVLSLERRQTLLRWADEREAIIIEDDYDSEFRHRGKSLEPLKVLDRSARVVYVGSFTKTLLPGTRIGYAVLPPALAGPFARAQQVTAGAYPVNLLEQRALAAFMTSGEYERHLRRMKRTYSRKFHLLAQLLREHLSRWFDWVDSDAGLHLFGWWRHSAAAYAAYRRLCAALGVRWAEADGEAAAVAGDALVAAVSADAGSATAAGSAAAASKFAASAGGGGRREPPRCGVYLNFPHLSEEGLTRGVLLMRQAGEQLDAAVAD